MFVVLLFRYPQKHANVIYPLGITVGGVTSTIQIVIFTWYNQSPEAQIYVRYRNIRII